MQSNKNIFTYQVKSHHATNEKGFVLVRLELNGHGTNDTHPANWEFEVMVREDELDGWTLGTFKRIGVHEPHAA